MGSDVNDPESAMSPEMLREMEWLNELAWYGEAKRYDGYMCEMFPPKLYSNGIWEKVILNVTGLQIWQYRLPNIELVILLVFVLWQVFAILFKKLGLAIPKFASMMLVSFLLFFFFISFTMYTKS